MKCRHCSKELRHTFLDLGFAPPSNAYLSVGGLFEPEVYYPLRIMVCNQCWLVQTEDYAKASELFNSEYAYFSSTSTSWLEHAKCYVEKISKDLSLDENSLVIEVASNDGYLLKNFLDRRVPCLGVEPTTSTANMSEKLGIPVIREFFGEKLGLKLAQEDSQADLIVGNNVYAHVPNINDFTLGLKAALKPNGVITLEFPHLMRLIESNQFDTIYHEHFSYLSLYSVSKIFKLAGLRIWNVEELPTHGGSLRVYGCHDSSSHKDLKSVCNILSEERRMGLHDLVIYQTFQEKVNALKNDFLEFLISQKKLGKKVAAYGAAAKGSTLLNYAGVKADLLPFVCDAAASKQGKYMPGSHIPILPPSVLESDYYDFIIIFPWNISKEIASQLSGIVSHHTKFVTFIPSFKVL